MLRYLLVADRILSMLFDSPGGARVLLSATVGYTNGKYQRMAFMDNAVEHAAMQVAKQHEELVPGVFPAAFEKDEVEELIDEFDAGGDPITVERVADTLNQEMLDQELDIDTEQLVADFFENLEQEISQDEEIGRKLHTIYHQRHSAQANQILDALEELPGKIEPSGKSEFNKLAKRDPTELTERGFLDGISVFNQSKPSYNSFVGLYALAHDPYDAQNRTALEKQIDVAENVIKRELAALDKNKLRVLDIGCGTGELVKFLEGKDEIEEVVGLDRSKGMRDAAKYYTRVESRIYEYNILRANKIERSDFDIAFMFRTFTYLYENEEVEQALRNISNLLTPGGLLVFDCVDKDELWQGDHIPKNRNYSFDEPADLSLIPDAPDITVNYEGKYNSEDLGKGKYSYETYYRIKPSGGDPDHSQAKFEIFEKEYLRAMKRSEVKNHIPPRFEIEGEQRDFNPNEDTPVSNFLNFLRKRY